MPSLYRDECLAAGLDYKAVRKLANDLSAIGRRARAMGITIFGNSGSGVLIGEDGDPIRGQLVLAEVDGMFDGGDNTPQFDEEGLQRMQTE